MAYKPPTTPPLLLILFSAIHVVIAVLNLSFGLVKQDTNRGTVFLNIARLAVAASYVWLAGTLPLQPILPARNVAGNKEVRTFGVYISLALMLARRFHL